VKSQTLSASVALGAMADVKALKKSVATVLVPVGRLGLEKTGPKPLAYETAHANMTMPKIGMRTIFTMKRYRSLEIWMYRRGSWTM